MYKKQKDQSFLPKEYFFNAQISRSLLSNKKWNFALLKEKQIKSYKPVTQFIKYIKPLIQNY